MAVSREKWEEEIEEIKWLVGHDGLKTTQSFTMLTHSLLNIASPSQQNLADVFFADFFFCAS